MMYIHKYIHTYVYAYVHIFMLHMHTIVHAYGMYNMIHKYSKQYAYTHNPYKMQNMSPAHKAMKTFNWSKQVQLTPCKYKDHSSEQTQTLYEHTICKLYMYNSRVKHMLSSMGNKYIT